MSLRVNAHLSKGGGFINALTAYVPPCSASCLQAVPGSGETSLSPVPVFFQVYPPCSHIPMCKLEHGAHSIFPHTRRLKRLLGPKKFSG